MPVTNGVVGHVVRQAVSYVRCRFPGERVSPASHRARYGVPDDVTEFSVVRPEATVSACPGRQACSPDNRRRLQSVGLPAYRARWALFPLLKQPIGIFC
ncbi:MAG: hypothetical protein ACYCV7_07700, partial [Acidimicrobiales bacterium]